MKGAVEEQRPSPLPSNSAYELGLPKKGSVAKPCDPVHLLGFSLAADDSVLSWDNPQKLLPEDYIRVTIEAVKLRPGGQVEMQIPLPLGAREWLPDSGPLNLYANLERSTADDTVHMSFHFAQDEKAAYHCVQFESRAGLTRWDGATCGVTGSSPKSPITLFAAWTLHSDAESDPVPLQRPLNGRSEITQRFVAAQPLPYQYTAKFSVFETSEKEISRLVSAHERLTASETTPDGLVLFDADGEEEGLRAGKHTTLLTSPRVTFHPEELDWMLPGCAQKLVAPNPVPDIDVTSMNTPNPFTNMFSLYSSTFNDFCSKEVPRAVIADVQTEYFKIEGDEKRKVSRGYVAGIRAKASDDPDVVDVSLYYNQTAFKRRSRGILFWKRELLPDILESPVTLKFQQRLGHTAAFVTQAPDSQKPHVVLVTITKEMEEGGVF